MVSDRAAHAAEQVKGNHFAAHTKLTRHNPHTSHVASKLLHALKQEEEAKEREEQARLRNSLAM